MRLTKKQINEGTTVKKTTASFNPERSYKFAYEYHSFESPLGHCNIYLTEIEDELTGRTKTTDIGDCNNKKKFVDAIYDYFNK